MVLPRLLAFPDCYRGRPVLEVLRLPERVMSRAKKAPALPSIVHGMSDTVYHADPIPGGSMSSTFARLLTSHVPAKALERRRNRKPTKAMNLGKAVHTHALGAGPQLITWQYDGRTAAGKAERAEHATSIAAEEAVAVTEAEREQLEGMVEVLRSHPEVAKILDASQPEVSAFWQEGGTSCRARYDLLGDDEAFDYKTTQDVSPRGFSKAMASYGYHQQAEFYLRGLKALAHPAAARPLRFICQETEPPYLVQIHTPDETAMETAVVLNDRAIRIYAQCAASGIWPAYPAIEAEPVSLPTYYFFDLEDVLPDGYLALDDRIEV